ncbi:acetylornithine transaminase [Rothia sp. ZJ1223]|uniref:acetylornithine transaminase n=1 Tax=Rothia sp. ZJ1223 TaxID=2811098 RepID=UPI00195CAB05|nr:acetylornithine transaminase [Rothia sp. ZJ1223]MBM7051253.1 acetylornithine transaminase [Rothia sp. ZJ1223]
MNNKGQLAQYGQQMLGVFGTPSLSLVEGKGCAVTDANGKTYLDLLAGIAVNSLGHSHPAWVKAVRQQAGQLAHISNFFTSPQQLALADALLTRLGTHDARIFFCNSGTEANEAAFKIARRHGNETGKKTILALEHAFHGRTAGALAMTHKPAYREPFEPLLSGIKHIPATPEALEEHLDDSVAALILEPIQGEAGVKPLPVGYLTKARALTRAHGALLLVDEVQTGMGRTGRWFESSRELTDDKLPDVITLAKGLGGGFPIGAVIMVGEYTSTLLQPGMHGTTYGGNPLATAAALATVETIDAENLMEHAAELGERVRARLDTLDCVASTRGQGLLIGIELAQGQTGQGQPLGPAVVNTAREQGFIINATGASTLRLAPPLIITEAELNTFIDTLPQLVADAHA